MPNALSSITIGNTKIAANQAVYFIAELSANHNQEYDKAIKLVHAAAKAGANAIKLQTYTPDTITIKSDRTEFQVDGTIWEGTDLHSLYQTAYTPWEWHKDIFKEANRLGMHAFSSPFDSTSVDFLENLNVPAYKIASSELVDIPLLKQVATTKKPIILSTGMATKEEIEEAVETLRSYGCKELALLKCTAAYPARPEEANLLALPQMGLDFGCPVGLSDHTLGSAVPIVASTLGACIIEKHFIISRRNGGPDASFSIEPTEYHQMVKDVADARSSMGSKIYAPTEKEKVGLKFRKSIYVIKDANVGDVITKDHIRCIRPACGMHTRHFDKVVGMKFAQQVKRGTPLTSNLISSEEE